MNTTIISIANEKGGVGKTTTTINLAQSLVLDNFNVLIVDLDPQGNTTQGLGVSLDSVQCSMADLIRNYRELPLENVIYKGSGIDLIPATPLLSRVEREMIGLTNSELRVSYRLREMRDRYSFILIDTPPSFGPLINSALNASDYVIVPVDCGFFGVLGIKELLSEIEEIQKGTNPRLQILGYLCTLADRTKMTEETYKTLVHNFGDKVFKTRIRRSVKLKESPAFGRTIFHHAPKSQGAFDYRQLTHEILEKLNPSEVQL